MRVFSRSIIGVLVLLLIEACAFVESNECYSCIQCSEPYNTTGASRVSASDSDYCFKSYVNLGVTRQVNRGNAGSNCKSVANFYYCCKGHLCNGNVPAAAISSIVLGVAVISLFAYRSFF